MSTSPSSSGGDSQIRRLSISSSLGILTSSEMCDLSSSSYEGVGQQMSPVDVSALEADMSQLRHTVRTLQEERGQLQLQLLQLEEASQLPAAEMAQLTKRNASMSAELQRIPTLRYEAERLHEALEAATRRWDDHVDQAAHQERLIAAQRSEIDLLAAKLSAAESEVARAARRHSSLQLQLEEAGRAADLLMLDVRDRDDRNATAQAQMATLRCSLRDLSETDLARQEELETLRRRGGTPAGRAASCRSEPPPALQVNGSIHDEIISTIQTSGDGDPVLPLSGIASPELVQAIYDSPLHFHCKTVPRRLRMASTPQQQQQQQQTASLLGHEESAELDDQFSSAASNSQGSPDIWQSQPPAAADVAVQTEHTEAVSLDRRGRGLVSDTTCAAIYGSDQGAEDVDLLSAADQRWLGPALPHTDGLDSPLPHCPTELFTQLETMFAGGSCCAVIGSDGMKRIHSDGALSATTRTRFRSMPTVEEVPDDPDMDMPQHWPLRASFSLPCDPNEVGIFPSLTEHMLADLHAVECTLLSDENANNTNEKDLESKFGSLALAFKTDRLTLHERLDVQRRHRDQAEHNLDLEAQRFREQLMTLTQSDADRSEQTKSLQRQVDIIKQISQRLSRTAEVLGAAQQELRVSRAVEVMTQHVESLRHLYEREHAELEEARRVLATNNISLHEPAQKTAVVGRRRASIAVFAPRSAAQPLVGLGALGGHAGQLSPMASSPAAPSAGLRRRRNSLGAGDADGFGDITEEKEEERTEPEQPRLLPSSEQQKPAADAAGEQPTEAEQPQQGDLRTHVEEAVSDELATLRSEQEQLANDLKTLLSRQRDAVLQQTTSFGKRLWDAVHLAWPYSREQTVVRARYCFGGLFLLLAVLMLLVPPASTSCYAQPRAFYSWQELLEPYLSLRHARPPPL